MGLVEKLKKIIAGGLIVTSILGAGNVTACEKEEEKDNFEIVQLLSIDEIVKKSLIPKRKFEIDFISPKHSFEANSNLWNTSNQIFGKGNDYLGINLNWDKNLAGRLGLFSTSFLVNYISRFCSHEVGHYWAGNLFGKYDMKFELNSFFNLDKNFPKKNHYSRTNEERIIGGIAGLNQDEFNSYLIYKNNFNEL
ncbi:unnamed protein product, partial [marine sediment metagenome]